LIEVLFTSRLEPVATADVLTDSLRRVQDDYARANMVAQAGRSLEPLAVLALDLANFEKINKGDDVLAAVGPLLAEGVRESDFAARAGGEEFSILLPGTDEEGAREVAEQLGRPRRSTPRRSCARPTAPFTWPRRTGATASKSRRPRRQSAGSGAHARLATESAFQALMVTIRPSRAATSGGLNSAATSS
jgi:GGDEF domain-containing protein